MITVEVCVGSACHLKGAYDVINAMRKIVEERNLKDKIIIKAAFCLGNCTNAVSVRIDQGEVLSVRECEVGEFFDKHIGRRL